MKTIKLTLLLTSLLILVSCGAKLSSTMTNKLQELPRTEPVALLDEEHEIPGDVIKVGNLHFQDSGFSTNCAFNSLMVRARDEARKNGANIVKVTEKKNPDLWSSCYRLKIDLYRFKGDVTTLPQYQLQLD